MSAYLDFFRVCGMDEFQVVVQQVPAAPPAKGEEPPVKEPIPVHIADQGDGTYLVTYTLPEAGKYKVSGGESKKD